MNIAMLGHKRIQSREGGVEVVVRKLSFNMVEMGNHVVAYNRKSKYIKNINELDGIEIVNVPTFERRSLNAMVYSFIASIKATFGKYDVIHFHAEGACVALLIPYLLRKKTVVTIHGLDWTRSKWGGFASRYIKLGEKIAAKYADEIIVLSKNVQHYFKETYDRDVHYIPNGVDQIKRVKVNKIKKKYNLEKNKYILFLARLVPEKGLHYLIDAYTQIDTDVKLVIAGGSSHTDEYVEQIKEKVKDDNRIIMTGMVKGRVLEELFSNTLLYILPSDIEGMPLSLLEALSFGCPCLVSDIQENIEVTGKYAYSFKRGNVEDLKEKLQKCILDENLDEKKREFPKELKNRFDWKNITKQHLEIYKKAINGE